LAAEPSSLVILMIVPVTVTASVVLAPCPLPFDSGCANASGASSAQQTRMVIVFFILDLLLMLILVRDSWLPFTKGFRNPVLHEIFDFFFVACFSTVVLIGQQMIQDFADLAGTESALANQTSFSSLVAHKRSLPQ
jgi:hypothetical protein